MNHYEKNMKALREFQPNLATWLEAQPKEIEWLQRLDDGSNLTLLMGARSKPVYNDEAEKQIKEIKKLSTLRREDITVFVGMGLGNIQAAALKQAERGHVVFVVEPCGQIIRWAFERHDFSKAIADKSLLVCVGENEVSVYLSVVESRRVVNDWWVIVEPYAYERREYMKLFEHTQQVVNQLRCNTGTVASSGAKIADNDIATLPYVIRHRGVNELKDLYRGKPAILVSTGPSLDRNIHLLRKVYEEKTAVIVAVGQALRPLLAYDIRPDFICTVDFGEVNMSHFAGLLDEDVPLVTINRTYAPLVREYKGPKFICAHVEPGFEKSAHSVLADKGEIEQGGSVAHMVFGLALHLGCDPLILVGQDLALTDGKSHFNQADSSGTVSVENGEIRWKVSDPRSTLHGGDYSMGDAVTIQGYYGEPVLTNSGLLSFLTTIETMAKFCGRTVINATEGGAWIRNTIPMFLDDALTKYCGLLIDKSVVEPLLTILPDADGRVREAVPLLENDVAQLKTIKAHCEESIKHSDKLLKAHSIPVIKELLVLSDTATAKAELESRKCPLVGLAIFWAQRRIMQRDMLNNKKRTQIDHLIRNKKDLRVRINRSKTIVKAALDACEALLKTHEESLRILKEYIEWLEVPRFGVRIKLSPLDPIGETSPPSLDDAQQMLDAGNFAKPLLEARRILDNKKAYNIVYAALKIRDDKIADAIERREADRAKERHKIPMYFKHLEESQEAGKEKRYDDALKATEEAIGLLPSRMEGRWGKATALSQLKRFDDAVAEYDALVKDFPDQEKFVFERAQTLLRTGDPAKMLEGLRVVGELIKKSDRYDHTLVSIARLCKALKLYDQAKMLMMVYCAKFPDDVNARKEFYELSERTETVEKAQGGEAAEQA